MRELLVHGNRAKLYYGEGPSLDVVPRIHKGSVHCVVTSPPYFGLRNYEAEGQIGLEDTPDEYIQKLVCTFDTIRETLHDHGTVWVNLGDSYWGSWAGSFKDPAALEDYTDRMRAEKNTLGVGDLTPYTRNRSRDDLGLKPKDLIGIPWMFAFAMRSRGWYLRTDIIWNCPNKMPESCKDRPGRAHEYVFLFSKSKDYFYDDEAVRVPSSTSFDPNKRRKPDSKSARTSPPNQNSPHRGGREFSFRSGTRRSRSVWDITLEPFKGAHSAPYPTKLVEPCVKAGTSERGCCPVCFNPYKRVLDKVRVKDKETDRDWQGLPSFAPPQRGSSYDPKKQGSMEPEWEYRTIGWESTCKCNAGNPIPCVVLDPFSGSGTTGLVATSLGRDYIGVDINPEYESIAVERISGQPPQLELQGDLSEDILSLFT